MKSKTVGWSLERAHESSMLRSIADYTLGVVIILTHFTLLTLRERRKRSKALLALANLE